MRFNLLLLLLIWLLLQPDVASVDDLPFFAQANFIASSASIGGYPSVLGFNHEHGVGRSSPKRSAFIKRNRKSVCSIFEEFGPIYGRRAHRMKEASFWKLCRILRPHLKGKKRTGEQEGNPNGAANGLVPTPTKISVALRWFAGGDACDIALTHGVSHASAFKCTWQVVDAANSCPELAFRFPSCHEEQRKIARGFQDKSKADFSNCCGAIDGLLMWMEKPSDISCSQAQCGTSKFMCGGKKKFGLNLQGTVDSHRRFLDISICHPASTSDCLAFSAMQLWNELERPGFLAPGLCLFGDNACVSAPCMAVPCKNVKGGVKDDCNFYHSQARITVECAFGMLVQRWGVLRKPLSAKITTKKVTSLVMALCRLHNHCINEQLKPNGETTTPRPAPPVDEELINLASDALSIAINSGIEVGNNNIPGGLLHGGEHFDDVPNPNMRRCRVGGSAQVVESFVARPATPSRIQGRPSDLSLVEARLKGRAPACYPGA